LIFTGTRRLPFPSTTKEYAQVWRSQTLAQNILVLRKLEGQFALMVSSMEFLDYDSKGLI